MSDICALRLVSGEELITQVMSDSATHTTIKNPLVVIVGNSPNGLVANFMPWTIVGEGEIPVLNSAISARYDVPKEVQDSYIQNTTGLQIVSSAPSQLLKG